MVISVFQPSVGCAKNVMENGESKRIFDMRELYALDIQVLSATHMYVLRHSFVYVTSATLAPTVGGASSVVHLVITFTLKALLSS